MGEERLVLKKEEQTAYEMRALFERYGYRRFEMSKFEEYDFYAENRSFLGSGNILTFTGLDGKLLALKPDVTLSIVKNSRADRRSPERIYYNENVYRARRGDGEYREILQAGLEYIGQADTCAVLEVLLLAIQSLKLIGDRTVMDLSHMGFVAGLLEKTGLGDGRKRQILSCIQEKNAHEIRKICREENVSQEMEERLSKLAVLSGSLPKALKEAKKLICGERMEKAFEELSCLADCLETCGAAKDVELDFSMVNDMDYYNGVMFQGYVDGIPGSVLRGGRYDNLVRRLGKDADAIGFAVYLDMLERFGTKKREFDVDVLLLYEEKTDPARVAIAARRIAESGESVMTSRWDSGEIRYRRLVRIEEGGGDEWGK